MRMQVITLCTARCVQLLATVGVIAVLTVGCTSQSSGDDASRSSTGTAINSASSVDTALYNGGVASSIAPPGSPTTQAPVSTSGPVPISGDISDVVPERTINTKAPVALNARANFGGDVSARLVGVKAVDAKAQRPGEVAGPAVVVTVEVLNASSDPIGLDAITVTLNDSADNPGSPLSSDPAKPLEGVLMPGQKKSGTYVFTVPERERGKLAIGVSYSTDAPTVQFTGSL